MIYILPWMYEYNPIILYLLQFWRIMPHVTVLIFYSKKENKHFILNYYYLIQIVEKYGPIEYK